MLHPGNYFHLYIGAQTNKGTLVAANLNSCITENSAGERLESFYTDNFPVVLYLRTLKEITEVESKELIQKGMSIGRPRGYSFSPDAFVYLLSLRIDIFGLIESRLAISVNQ